MEYPRFTGSEPCAQIGTDIFFPPEEDLRTQFTFYLQSAKEACQGCPMREPCLEYALHTRVSGVWGGTSLAERDRIRRQRGIIPAPVVAA